MEPSLDKGQLELAHRFHCSHNILVLIMIFINAVIVSSIKIGMVVYVHIVHHPIVQAASGGS